jgi:hypothetical protein
MGLRATSVLLRTSGMMLANYGLEAREDLKTPRTFNFFMDWISFSFYVEAWMF